MDSYSLHSFFRDSPVSFAIFDLLPDFIDARLRESNPAFARLWGKKPAEMEGIRISALISPEVLETAFLRKEVLEALKGRRPVDRTVDDFVPGRRFRIRLFPLETDAYGCVLRDVSDERLLRDAVEAFLGLSLEAICLLDPASFQILQVNPPFASILGKEEATFAGKPFFDLVHPDDRDTLRAGWEELRKTQSPSESVFRFRREDGGSRFLHCRVLFRKSRLILSARDVTEQRNEEEHLRQAATVDPLTGLYNRAFFFGILEERLRESEQKGAPLSMIAIDIDHFKNVNDTWGHLVGDEVLGRTARLLKDSLRSTDVISRVGGEEFAVLLPATGAEGGWAVAEKMRSVLEANPHPRIGRVTASFGVAEHRPGEDSTRWYKRADDATYQAKENGRNRVVLAGEPVTVPPVVSLYVKWRDEWNSGNAVIDRQHRELLDLGNHLIRMAVTGAPRPALSAEIETLLVHTVSHFAAEESIVAKTPFPGLRKHQEIHAELMARAVREIGEFLSRRQDSPIFLSFVMNDLILGHVRDEDTKFFPYLTAAPESPGPAR